MYTALLELASGNYFCFFAKEFECFLTALKKNPTVKFTMFLVSAMLPGNKELKEGNYFCFC